MKKIVFTVLVAAASLQLASCGMNRVESNYEGVLMTNYGRAGLDDFKPVTGAQGILGIGSELYQVPMFEQKADPAAIKITTKDAGQFTVDPTYTFAAIRGKGKYIVYAYKHVGTDDMLNKIAEQILNPIVLNAYREEARVFTTDSLMNNLNQYESNAEARLRTEFSVKYFELLSLTSGLTPPASMTAAIEARNNTKQQTERVRNELETAKMQLEKARIEAERDRIQSAGLTKEILTQQYIEMLKVTQNHVIITDGKTPVIIGK